MKQMKHMKYECEIYHILKIKIIVCSCQMRTSRCCQEQFFCPSYFPAHNLLMPHPSSICVCPPGHGTASLQLKVEGLFLTLNYICPEGFANLYVCQLHICICVPGTTPDCSPALYTRSCHLFELIIFPNETKRGLCRANAVQKTNGLQKQTSFCFTYPDSLTLFPGCPQLSDSRAAKVSRRRRSPGCPLDLRSPSTIPRCRHSPATQAGVASRRAGRQLGVGPC